MTFKTHFLRANVSSVINSDMKCVCVQATPQMTEQSDQDNRFRIDKEKAETPNISPIPNVLMRREIDPPLVR